MDFLTKKRVKNNGIVPQYYVENNHEPIIPRDLYMQVQEEMIRRTNLHSGENKKKRIYSSKYALSGIVYCGNCGDIYRRIAWNNRGKHSVVWRCVSRVEHGPSKCTAPTILEADLQAAVVKAMNLVLGDKNRMLKVLQDNIESVLQQEDETSLADIDAKMESLQKELLQRANGKVDYKDISDEIKCLREEKQNISGSQVYRQASLIDSLVIRFTPVRMFRLLRQVHFRLALVTSLIIGLQIVWAVQYSALMSSMPEMVRLALWLLNVLMVKLYLQKEYSF